MDRGVLEGGMKHQPPLEKFRRDRYLRNKNTNRMDRKCVAITAKGTRCKNNASTDDLCWVHNKKRSAVDKSPSPSTPKPVRRDRSSTNAGLSLSEIEVILRKALIDRNESAYCNRGRNNVNAF